MKTRHRVLIIDEELATDAATLRTQLEALGHEVVVGKDREAANLAASFAPDLAIVALDTPQAADIACALRAQTPHTLYVAHVGDESLEMSSPFDSVIRKLAPEAVLRQLLWHAEVRRIVRDNR